MSPTSIKRWHPEFVDVCVRISNWMWTDYYITPPFILSITGRSWTLTDRDSSVSGENGPSQHLPLFKTPSKSTPLSPPQASSLFSLSPNPTQTFSKPLLSYRPIRRKGGLCRSSLFFPLLRPSRARIQGNNPNNLPSSFNVSAWVMTYECFLPQLECIIV